MTTSELKSAASRANGAKSNGPKSPETRAISSRNSLTHGFTSKKTIVLSVENPEEFQQMLDYYAKTYKPGCPVEEDLVAEMVAARWRMRRLRLIETCLMDSELERQALECGFNSSTESESEAIPQDPGYKMAFAFRHLVVESRAISLASRYESRLNRIHEQAHRTLRELQQARRKQQTVVSTPTRTAKPVLIMPAPEPNPQPEPEKSQNEPTGT